MDAELPRIAPAGLVDRVIAFAEERRLLLEVAALGLACLILLVSVLPNLANHPAVTDDEIWVLSAAYKLAEEGVFGSDMFAGFFHADSRYFFNMPAHHFVVAGFIKVLGAGVAEARMASLVYGLVTIGLTYFLARRIAGVPVAMLSLGLLLFLRLNIGFDTGLPLQELSSTMRYDLAPVPFMLGAVLLLLHRVSLPRAALAGALSGLAFLLQFYGVFIIPPLLAWLWLEPGSRSVRLKLMAALVAASVVVASPYFIAAAIYSEDFRGQAGTIDNRADFADPSFYLDNIRNEPDRFLRPLAIKEIPRDADPKTTPPQHLSLQEALTRRPSAKLAVLVALPAALIFSGYLAMKQRSRPYQMVFLCLGGLVAQFAVLDQTKFFMYWIPVVPFLCIGAAAVSWWFLSRVRAGPVPMVLAAGTAAVLLLVAAEGSVARISGMRAASTETAYTKAAGDAHSLVPAGSRVVGSTSLWWGFRDTDYRSYFLFFYLTREDAGENRTTISGFLREFDPDYLVLTSLAWGELQDHLIPADFADLMQYLEANADIIRVLEGPDYESYGFIEVWRFR